MYRCINVYDMYTYNTYTYLYLCMHIYIYVHIYIYMCILCIFICIVMFIFICIWKKYCNSPAWINAMLGIVVPILTINIQNNNVARVFWCLFMALNIDRIWEQLLLSMFGRAKPWRWHDCFCKYVPPDCPPPFLFADTNILTGLVENWEETMFFLSKTAGVPGSWSGFQRPQQIFFATSHIALSAGLRVRGARQSQCWAINQCIAKQKLSSPAARRLGTSGWGGLNQ